MLQPVSPNGTKGSRDCDASISAMTGDLERSKCGTRIAARSSGGGCGCVLSSWVPAGTFSLSGALEHGALVGLVWAGGRWRPGYSHRIPSGVLMTARIGGSLPFGGSRSRDRIDSFGGDSHAMERFVAPSVLVCAPWAHRNGSSRDAIRHGRNCRSVRSNPGNAHPSVRVETGNPSLGSLSSPNGWRHPHDPFIASETFVRLGTFPETRRPGSTAWACRGSLSMVQTGVDPRCRASNSCRDESRIGPRPRCDRGPLFVGYPLGRMEKSGSSQVLFA